LLALALATIWYTQQLDALFTIATLVSSHIDFALCILLVLDIVFTIIAEGLVYLVYR
jgi:hypothetical protein